MVGPGALVSFVGFCVQGVSLESREGGGWQTNLICGLWSYGPVNQAVVQREALPPKGMLLGKTDFF